VYMAGDDNTSSGLRFDEIGYWTEVKLDIVKEYAKAYTTILSKKQFSFAYIDGFAGSGVHLVRDTQEYVPGSPLNALRIDPPFSEYFLIDLDGDKVE
jgi:three-Cys-motif partner protein